MKVNEIDQLLNAYKELQNLQCTLDDLGENIHFKRRIKRSTNVLQTEIDKVLKPLYDSMSQTEKESFNKIILKNENVKTTCN